ncbi:nickel-dependent hydrogenase large subunit [Dehalobacter sp. DCM]|uniref:nickel-dependent hydrogenase large subunit n=1 Tax=Dehalobacter sp. DCM TaxID=2907827 RepID=UPI003081B551|nr:nickel-dependent hydrogenase large subunit [Dehalobacter sp. DCM]
MKKILIGTLSRLNNSSAVEVTIENKTVVDSQCRGIFYRGFERILEGKDPRDAGYITERICGICSSVHALAAAYALENAAGIQVPYNGHLMRNLIVGADILQNHIRHFYLFVLTDYIQGPQLSPLDTGYAVDKRFPKNVNDNLVKNMFQAIEISRLATEMIALIGGKTPFPHSILAGGCSVAPTADVIVHFNSKLKKINEFIRTTMQDDTHILADYYPDYFNIGKRKLNMLEFGLFPLAGNTGERYLPGGAVLNGELKDVNLSNITEHISRSWYSDNPAAPEPGSGITVADVDKKDAYSWVKAPRYFGIPMEGGPLVRLWIRGDYRNGISTMDRIRARSLEAEITGRVMETWLAEIRPGEPTFSSFKMPMEAESVGLTGAMRGPLGHWLKIKKGRIAHYEIITPSAWNFSPQDDTGQKGPVEEALIGTSIADEAQPIEIGRVIRAFDICSSCSTHIITPGSPLKEMRLQ